MFHESAHPAALVSRCWTLTILTVMELAVVNSLEDLVEPPSRHVRCELSAEHPDGRHTAFVAAAGNGDQSWWLSWSPGERELFHREVCDGVDVDAGDDCLLPARHPGGHSFDLASPHHIASY